MREINKHIVHCSASPASTTKEDLYRWHVQENGWSDIGYHFMISQDGEVHGCRPIEVVGAHCRGHNTGSIGTCLIGNDKFTSDQLKSLQSLHNILKIVYGDSITIHGHREFTDSKTCPNFDVHKFIS